MFCSHILNIPISNYCSSSTHQLEAQGLPTPTCVCNVSPAVAGPAGEQATDHDGGKSGEADPPHLNETESPSQPAPVPRSALAGNGADTQQ